jgi:signal transduction histidine kinase
MMTVFILSPVSIWLAYRRWREKETGSFFILLGFLITNLGVISVGLTLLGLWPSEIWQLHSRQISVMGNILAMHIAVAARFRYLKQSHREAVLLAARAETRMEQERRSQDEHRQFVAMLTHELRTPLSVIDGAVQSLEYLHQTVDDETQLRHHRIRRSVKRINGLIKQFIAKDRIEDSRLSLHLTCIDPTRLSGEVIDATLDNAKQRIDLVIPNELPSVYADNALIQVALSNLLDNALKYSPPNSRIEVSVTPLSIQGQAGVAWVVADQGAGIATDSPEDFFGKYVRGNEHVHIAGTGLGLYLVRRIAEKHGGTAEICVKEGWSGVVQLWLPAKKAAA